MCPGICVRARYTRNCRSFRLFSLSVKDFPNESVLDVDEVVLWERAEAAGERRLALLCIDGGRVGLGGCVVNDVDIREPMDGGVSILANDAAVGVITSSTASGSFTSTLLLKYVAVAAFCLSLPAYTFKRGV